MKHLHRISTIAFAAILSLTALMGLVNVAQAQDVPMAPEITASISGVVYSAAGQPLADIKVSVLSRGQSNWWSSVSTTRTDAAGAYTFGYLNTGIYRLGFEDSRQEFLPGYHPNTATVEEAQDIPLAGVDVTGLQTTLRPTLHIAGIVTDASGQPLPDIDVWAIRKDSYGYWSFDVHARTDASGAYHFSRLSPGTYRLGFRDPSEQFVTQYYSNAPDVESAQDIPVSDADVTGLQTILQRSAQITGDVTMWDGSLPDQATVTVYTQDDGEWRSVESENINLYGNPGMHYKIAGLSPGRYRIGVRGYDLDDSISTTYAEFYDDAVTVAEADDIVLEIGSVLSGVNFVLGANSHLSNMSGVVTTLEGTGLPGIVVTTYISQTGGWQELRQTRTITDGAYTTRALEAGDYAVRFHDPLRQFVTEYYDDAAEVAAATIISVTGGEDLTGIDSKLASIGRIVATVTMANGRSLEFAEVRAYSGVSDYTEMVAMDYMYAAPLQTVTLTLASLSPGAYRLYVTARDSDNTYSEYYDNALLLENATDVIVLSGGMIEVHAVLGENPGYARITGAVRSPDSTPLADIKVTAYYAYNGGWEKWQSTFTDQAGSYTLGALTPNTYILLFEDQDGAYHTGYYGNATTAQSATQIRLEAQQTITGIDVILPQTGWLTGTVTRYDGRPPAWMHVTLYRWEDNGLPYGNGWVSVQQESLGTSNYRLTQVPTGYYRVGVSASLGGGENGGEQFFPGVAKIDDAQDIYVEDGKTTANINFVFGDDTRDARIEGQVYVDGIALSGMQIDLYTRDNYSSWWRLVYVNTDAAGAFRIDGLGAGEYRICVVDPAQVRETICYPGTDTVEGASSLQLADGQVISDLRIEMALFQHWSYLPIVGR